MYIAFPLTQLLFTFEQFEVPISRILMHVVNIELETDGVDIGLLLVVPASGLRNNLSCIDKYTAY